MVPTTFSETLIAITDIFPDFQHQWASSDNYHKDDDGSSSICGVWAEFSTWFTDSPTEPLPSQLSKLSLLVNNCFASPVDAQRGGVSTCFLENIAGDPRAFALKPLLSSVAQQFISEWEPAT